MCSDSRRSWSRAGLTLAGTKPSSTHPCVTAITTAIKGAAVIQRGRPPVAVAQLASGGSSALALGVKSVLKSTIHNSGGSSPCRHYQNNMSAAGIRQMCISVRRCGPMACTTLRALGHLKYRTTRTPMPSATSNAKPGMKVRPRRPNPVQAEHLIAGLLQSCFLPWRGSGWCRTRPCRLGPHAAQT